MTNATHHKFSDYWPLFSLVLITALSALVMTLARGEAWHQWMHYFMGLFLVFFATLKIFNIAKFAEGFSRYDLLAKRVQAYGFVYPVIELALGLAYLSFFAPTLTYVLTIIVMLFGTVGVVIALRQGLDVRCACMGSVLDVPLSTVTLTEDLAMSAMAVVMLVS